MKRLLISASVIAISATVAQSQVAFSNGGVSLSYSEHENNRAEETFLAAFGILGVSNAFDIQAGVDYHKFSYASGAEYSNIGYDAHFIYNFSNGSRLGAFYATTDVWNTREYDSYGLEYQFNIGPALIEAQGGRATRGNRGDNFIGADVTYAFGDFNFGAGYTHLFDGNVAGGSAKSVNRATLNAGYTIPGNGMEIYAGYARMSGRSWTNSKVEIGLSIPFGSGDKKAFGNPHDMLRDFTVYLD